MKEHNILAIATILLGAFCSCQPEAVEQSLKQGGGNYPLTFDVLISGSGNTDETKGTPLNTTDEADYLENYVSVIGSTFKVVSFDSNGSRFIPEEGAGQFDDVKYDSNKSEWAIEGKKYIWQRMDEKIFYACANMPDNITGTVEASIACADKSGATLTYTTVPANATAQNDILLGYYKGNGEYDAAKQKGGIARMTFYHPMTAVKFVKGDIEGDVKIKSIYLSNVYKSGTASITPASVAKSSPGDKVIWTPGSEMQTAALGDGTKDLPVDKGTNVIGGVNGVFLLVPQDLTTESVDFYMRAIVNDEPKSLTATISTGIWKAGCTNTYTINYDASNLFTLGQAIDLKYELSEGIDPVTGKYGISEWEVGEESGS